MSVHARMLLSYARNMFGATISGYEQRYADELVALGLGTMDGRRFNPHEGHRR